MVIARRDVGDERAERVEGRLVADLLLAAHVHLELVQRDVAGPLDHHLHVALPGALGQLAERLELGELRGVGGVGDRAGAQPVAERDRDVVARDRSRGSRRSAHTAGSRACGATIQRARMPPPRETIPVTRCWQSGRCSSRTPAWIVM